jgi:Family of unknown function (DUF6105)
MRYVLIFWAAPMAFIWGWYFLSLNDMNMGVHFFSRELHDLVFAIYGHILGIEPSTIPWLLAKACITDTVIIFSILAFRKRKAIKDWIDARRQSDVVEELPREIA